MTRKFSRFDAPEARELVDDLPQAADGALEQAHRRVLVAEVDDVGLSEGRLGFAHQTLSPSVEVRAAPAIACWPQRQPRISGMSSP